MQRYSINGKIVDAKDATISVNDHGFLYGDGVFEGLRFYNHRVLKMGAHLQRLESSAKAIRLELPMSLTAISKAITELITHCAQPEGYLRLVVTRGVGPLGIDPRQCEPGNVVIIADQLSMVSEAVRTQGADLIIASTRRLGPDQLDSRVKSLNYLNQILARIEANDAAADEAVILNQAGFVAEGTADNLFIVRSGRLLTPKITDGALEGITRAIVMDLARSLGIDVIETSLTTYDLFNAYECFLTGTGAELIPVKMISGRTINCCPGPVYQQVAMAFQEALKGDDLFL